MVDFTLKRYIALLETLREEDYKFEVFEEFLISDNARAVVLRHDVDKYPGRALQMAEIEASMGIKASYHFRIGKETFNPLIIKKLIALGHEIAYHYEDLSHTVRKNRLKYPSPEIYALAYSMFQKNLARMRQYYPVRVISMHGDPLSRVNNRDLWTAYNYKTADIICEPYIDIPYSEVAYLTDTGRKWNASGSNIRDRVSVSRNDTSNNYPTGEYDLKSTRDIILALKGKKLPSRLIVNTHPQRWNSETLPWITEFVFQHLKNPVKNVIFKFRHRKKG